MLLIASRRQTVYCTEYSNARADDSEIQGNDDLALIHMVYLSVAYWLVFQFLLHFDRCPLQQI